MARRHFAFDGLGPERVQLVEAAVSDRATRATLHQYDAHAMPYVNSLAAAVDTDAPPATIDVAVVTIDEVCRELNVVPTVIRMDVQGAEIHALRGAERHNPLGSASVARRRNAPAVLAGLRRHRAGRPRHP